MATFDEESIGGGEEEGKRNSRIRVFLSSIFSSFGGVFGSNFPEEPDNLTMASKAIAPIEQPRGLFVLSHLEVVKLKTEGGLVIWGKY